MKLLQWIVGADLWSRMGVGERGAGTGKAKSRRFKEREKKKKTESNNALKYG
jgi:hypothetical protein